MANRPEMGLPERSPELANSRKLGVSKQPGVGRSELEVGKRSKGTNLRRYAGYPGKAGP